MTELEKQQMNQVLTLMAQKIGELFAGMELMDQAIGVLDERDQAAVKAIKELSERVSLLETRLDLVNAQPSDFE